MALAQEIEVLEIMKRAKSGGEVVPWNQDVRDEALRRNVKAGYCNSDGSPIGATKIMSRGIGESKLNVWPRDKKGRLIGD